MASWRRARRRAGGADARRATDHLDVEAREVLVAGLERFRGVGLVVSHDRALLDRIAGYTVRVHDGGARISRGSYSDTKCAWEAEEREHHSKYEALKNQRATLVRRLADKRRLAMSAESEANAGTRKRMKFRGDHDATCITAVVFNVLHLPVPDFAIMALHLLGQTVSGLMLLILGMALRSSAVSATLGRASSLVPTLLIKLALSPLIVLVLGRIFKLPALALHATTVEAAMPPQLFTLIVADRFNLDTENLAVAVAVLTSLSFLTVPLVNQVMT